MVTLALSAVVNQTLRAMLLSSKVERSTHRHHRGFFADYNANYFELMAWGEVRHILSEVYLIENVFS
jgi:hypothetical protein